jgi:hypothetical protein
MRKLIAASLLLALATPALANDTTAQLGTGGLIFVRSDAVAMEREDLFISEEEVRVAYVFRNLSDKDVESIVAFPMPDIQSSPYANVSIPDRSSDNFLGFKVTVDGKAVEPALDQRAFAAEIDVTEELKAAGVPLFPYADETDAALAQLPEAKRDDWIARGLVIIETYDAGEGMRDHYTPTWTLKSTYWWRTLFPAGKPVDVRHSYSPSVGGTVGLTFVTDGSIGGPGRDEYRAKYCMDGAFERTVQKAVDGAEEGSSPYHETWISYVLKTGANWATNIGTFKLTIDKGAPGNLVSFCGEGVKKTGPTTFEMTATDFYPTRDIEILILKKFEDQQ